MTCTEWMGGYCDWLETYQNISWPQVIDAAKVKRLLRCPSNVLIFLQVCGRQPIHFGLFGARALLQVLL